MSESYKSSRVYSDEDFVRAWMDAYHDGKTARQVGEELGLSTKHVYYRVDKLRGEGVDLPNFRERIMVRNKDHISKLNNLIKDLDNGRN